MYFKIIYVKPCAKLYNINVNLTGKKLSKARSKYFIDRAIFLVKKMILEDQPKDEIKKSIIRIKGILSQNCDILGEDFCIDKGMELEQVEKLLD